MWASNMTMSPSLFVLTCKRRLPLFQPLNNANYVKDIFAHYTKHGSNKFCYNDVLSSNIQNLLEGPTTAQLLVMFRENYVEHKCKVYASLSSAWSECDVPEQNDLKEGLYEVIDDPDNACVTYHLLYEEDHLGQIVATSMFDPIEIVGVKNSPYFEYGMVFGYYPNGGAMWSRKQTVIGDATDGSLSVEPGLSTQAGRVTGISNDGKVRKVTCCISHQHCFYRSLNWFLF